MIFFQNNKQQSREQNVLSPKRSKNVSVIKNIDTKHHFFTSLHLQKKVTEFAVPIAPHINGQTCEVQTNDFNKYRRSPVNGHLDSKNNNFKTSCHEFEDKLPNKSREILDMDELDYSEDAEENYDYLNNYYSEEECYNGNLVHNEAVNVDAESTDMAITKLSGNIEKPKLDINANNNFALTFSRLFLDIKEAFLKVQSFW